MKKLVPEPPNGRSFYHYRNGTVLIGVVVMTDTKAIERRQHGWDLWPCEWGLREKVVRS